MYMPVVQVRGMAVLMGGFLMGVFMGMFAGCRFTVVVMAVIMNVSVVVVN